MGFQLSGVSDSPWVIQIISFLLIAGTPDTRIAKDFWIFTESIMLNNLQSIAHENRYQHLDSSEAAPSQYISNNPGIERLAKQYRVDVSYHKTRLTYSRLTRSILPSIFSLSNEIQGHLRSTLLSSAMVSGSTLCAYSIQRLISKCRYSLFKYNPTPGTPLNREYPLCITFESVLPAHRVSSVSHETFRCRRGSSHSNPE
jgi:hypothetical protein